MQPKAVVGHNNNNTFPSMFVVTHPGLLVASAVQSLLPPPSSLSW